jgi:hypothetical protein
MKQNGNVTMVGLGSHKWLMWACEREGTSTEAKNSEQKADEMHFSPANANAM